MESCNTKSSLDLPLESLSLQPFLQSLHKEQWQEVRLGEVAEIFDYQRIPLSTMQRMNRKGAYPYYGASGVIDYIDDFIFDGEFVLISEDGENLRTRKTPIAFKVSGKFWVNNHAHIVKGKQDYFNDLIVYLFENLDLNPYITGAVQPKLNQSTLLNIPLKIPILETTQQKIAEILSSFDDKIDLLHRQNKTLESLAITLFRHYFIDNPKRDEWEEKPLSEIAEIQNGYAFKNSDYAERGMETYEVLKMGHIESGGGLRYFPKAHYVKINDKMTKWVLNEDDIVLAMTDMKDSLGILGYPAMVDKSNYYVLNQRVARIYLKSKDDFLHNYFLFLYLSLQENIQKLQSLANGGVQVNLSTEAIKNFTITIPPLEFQSQNNQAFINIIKKYKNNRKQIQNLQAMRDMLLKAIFA